MTMPRTSFTAVELLQTDFPEPRFAVPNVVAEGLTLLVGAPKLGKSWLALNLAIAVASGGRALGAGSGRTRRGPLPRARGWT